jgi:hypothetical protein
MSIWRTMGERTAAMLVRPGWGFRAAAEARGPGFTLAFGALLLAVPQIVLMVMGAFGVGFRNVGGDAILTAGLTGFAAGVVLLFATAGLVRWLARALDGVASYARALGFVVHATVPAWVLGTAGNLASPRQQLFAMIGIGWSIVLFGVGAGPMLAIPRGKRVVFAFAGGIGMALIWAVALVAVALVLAGVLERELAERLVRGM